jgi:hypothetical protein
VGVIEQTFDLGLPGWRVLVGQHIARAGQPRSCAVAFTGRYRTPSFRSVASEIPVVRPAEEAFAAMQDDLLAKARAYA